VLLLLALAGCSQKRLTVSGPYRFERLQGQEMLTPPGASPAGGFVLPKARSPRRKACDAKAGAFTLTWKGRTAQVQVARAGLEEGGRVALALLDEIDRFRTSLLGLETNGCLKPGEAGPLLSGIVEGLALPSRVTFYLRHGTSVQSGYVDLRPPFRMKVVAPLKEEGQTLGFETAWYRMEPSGPVLERVEAFRRGVLTVSEQPLVAKVPLPRSARCLLLFFLTRRSAADHDILLLGAASPRELEERTAMVRKEPEASCRRFAASCFLAPPGMAISGELPVRAGTKQLYVSITGTVGEALRTAGAPNARQIRVRRPHQGRPVDVVYDPAQIDIRGLVILGGEEIDWEQP